MCAHAHPNLHSSIMGDNVAMSALAACTALMTIGVIALTVLLRRVWITHPDAVRGAFRTQCWQTSSVKPESSAVSPAAKAAPGSNKYTPAAAVSAGGAKADHKDVSAVTRTPENRQMVALTRSNTPAEAMADWEIDPRKLKMKFMIGKGNFGEVWLATWLGSPVAVKTVVPELQVKERLVKRFVDEMMLMSTLHHPNIVLFLGACTKRPHVCIVMEHCVHGSLHSFLKTEHEHGTRISMSLIYRFALDIARGVHYLHTRCSIVQRDLKARNILVDESLNAKVADFGLSRVIDLNEKNKLTACGTPAWTAPEIIRMERYTDKVDVYSFGIIMWEMVTRQEPYGGQKGVQIAYAAAEQGLRPEIPAYCPPEYGELMQQCWASNPNDRPSFRVILKRLFQMKKAADAEASGGSGSAVILPPAPDSDDEDDSDSADQARVLLPPARSRRPLAVTTPGPPQVPGAALSAIREGTMHSGGSHADRGGMDASATSVHAELVETGRANTQPGTGTHDITAAGVGRLVRDAHLVVRVLHTDTGVDAFHVDAPPLPAASPTPSLPLGRNMPRALRTSSGGQLADITHQHSPTTEDRDVVQ